jgi:hypothetical protein
MRVRVGDGTFNTVKGDAAIRAVTDKLEAQIMSSIKAEAMEFSYDRMKKVRDQLEAVVTLDAMGMLSNAASIIDANQKGFTSANLPGGLDIRGAGGSIRWPALTPKYALWKANREKNRIAALKRGLASPRNLKSFKRQRSQIAKAESMFYLDGQLRSYFKRGGRTVVNRMGGIDISLTTERPDTVGGRRKLNTIDTTKGVRWKLGEIHAHIFPRVVAGLLPGLASNRWTDTSKYADFEHGILPTRIFEKLSGGKHGPYRPLVLPIVQFYILKRIPYILEKGLKKAVSKMEVTRDG